jgi:hypothetical protein
MVPVRRVDIEPVPPPAHHRARRNVEPAPHLDALRLVRRLHLLAFCRVAVRLAYWHCPPPLPNWSSSSRRRASGSLMGLWPGHPAPS